MLARRDRDRSTHGRPPDSKGGSNRSYLGDLSWRGLRAVGPIHWSAAAPWRGARVAVGVLVPLAIGSATGHLSYGAFAALGALPAGFASFQGVARTRLAAVSMASLGIAISTFVGATTAAVAPWLLVAVVIVWGYLIGLAVSLGQRLSVATLQCGAGLTVAVGMPLGPGPAGARAGFALAGGVLQGLLVAGSWIVRPGDTERKAIGDAYLALAAYAREVADGSTETPSAVEFSAAAVLKDPNPLLREATQLQLLDLLEEAERVRASLAALAAEMGSAGPDANARVRRLTAAAAATLSLVAATLTARRHDRAERAGELTRQVGAVIVPASPGVRPSSDALSGQLRAIARIVVDVADGPPARDRPGSAPDASRPRGRDGGAVGATLRANVSLSSEAGRHAVRMAAIAGVAEVMVLATGLSEGRWVVLTLFIVLRPDYGSTVSRSVQRAVGTALGVGLGVAAVQFGRLGQWELVTVAGVAVAAAYALFDVAYVLYCVFLSAFIVVLLDILGTPAVRTATSRLADTAIGAALAVIAYLVWPTWEAASARDTFAALLEAHGAYATALLRELAHPGQLGAGRLRRLQVTAQRARSDAEASAARLSEEPPEDPVIPQFARRLVATVRRLTQAELAAHTLITLQHVPEGLEDEIVPRDCSLLLDRLASMVATAMSAIAGSLRSMEPTAAVVDLRQTQAQLASRAAAAAPALASATDGLVDAVDTLESILRDYVKIIATARPERPAARRGISHVVR